MGIKNYKTLWPSLGESTGNVDCILVVNMTKSTILFPYQTYQYQNQNNVNQQNVLQSHHRVHKEPPPPVWRLMKIHFQSEMFVFLYYTCQIDESQQENAENRRLWRFSRKESDSIFEVWIKRTKKSPFFARKRLFLFFIQRMRKKVPF